MVFWSFVRTLMFRLLTYSIAFKALFDIEQICLQEHDSCSFYSSLEESSLLSSSDDKSDSEISEELLILISNFDNWIFKSSFITLLGRHPYPM